MRGQPPPPSTKYMYLYGNCRPRVAGQTGDGASASWKLFRLSVRGRIPVLVIMMGAGRLEVGGNVEAVAWYQRGPGQASRCRDDMLPTRYPPREYSYADAIISKEPD